MSRFNPKPEHVEFFRASTANAVFYVLRRKECVCGRRITAKQLTQFGVCEKCLKVKNE